jgi:hypothetical protein
MGTTGARMERSNGFIGILNPSHLACEFQVGKFQYCIVSVIAYVWTLTFIPGTKLLSRTFCHSLRLCSSPERVRSYYRVENL